MNLVIYTAIFGDFDKLRKPKIINKDIKYICFSDKKIRSNTWEVRVVEPEYQNNRKEARKYKILSHLFFKDYKYTAWVDGQIKIGR